MTAKVIMWPPVGAIGTEWTEVAPVQVSRSMVTGAERVSAIQRKRRMASLTVSGFGRTPYDAGYMEMLKRFLEGVHLVRLYSYPIAWHFDRPERAVRRGRVYNDNGRTYVEVFGVKPDSLVMRPADFLTLFLPSGDTTELQPLDWFNSLDPLDWQTDGTTNADPVTWFSGIPYNGTTVQATQPVRSDGSGRAIVPVFETIPNQTDIYLVFGSADTAAFRPVEYPRSRQPHLGNWEYEWEFREVFADEVGGFTEVNPWAP
jgi:hypothetical protein